MEEKLPVCQPDCAEGHGHPTIPGDGEEGMPPEEILYDLAELYKIFGDSTRIKILYALFDEERCVCDIAGLLHMSMSAISHQLRVLKQAKLVKFRRAGRTVYYALSDGHVRTILGQGMEHICE